MPLVALIFLFLAIAACFEGAETSLLSIGDVRLQTLLRSGDKRAAMIIDLRRNVRRLLGTVLLGQTVCDIAAASIATLVAHEAYGEAGVAIETVVMTIIVLVFVNLIPKSHAANHIEQWALAAALPVKVLTVVLGPVVGAIDRFVALFVRDASAEVLVTEEEIRTMTSMGAASGAVEHGERELIERVFLFNDITAHEVLTPRELMVALDAAMTVDAAIAAIAAHKYSRYPVRDADGTIVGIVHLKDLLESVAGGASERRIGELATPPVFVSEETATDDLFRLMKKKRQHMAIVTDKAGAIIGLVTLEDLLEEIVGEIADESDVDEYVIKRIDRFTILAHGDTDIPDINRFFNVKIEPGDERTIGRFVRKQAGKALKPGQPVVLGPDLIAVVEQANRGRVLKVRLIKTGEERG